MSRVRTALLALALVVGGGLLIGGITSPLQGLLPDALSSFANSAGAWTACTFVLVLLSRARPPFGAVLGAAGFLALVEGYRLVSTWRGIDFGAPFSGIWTIVALIAGPVVGAAAAFVGGRDPRWAALATSPVAAVLVGEGVYGLTVIAATTSPVYWGVQIAGGAVLVVIVLVRRRPEVLVTCAAVGLTLVGAALFLVAYSALG